MNKDLLIIMPAFNEADTIGKVLDQLKNPEITSIADVLVMNDASFDNTRQVVEEKGIPVLNHIFNLGYGSALQLGYKYAVRRNYKYVIQMDSDGQHDICNISKIYKELTTADENGDFPDIVLGSRYMEGSSEFKTSRVKKLAFFIFRSLIKLLADRNISDPTSGLQGLNRRTFTFYSRYNHFDDRYPDANIIIQMLLLGFKIKEIPAVMHQRISGTSIHSGLKPILYMFRMTLSIFVVWARIKQAKSKKGVVIYD